MKLIFFIDSKRKIGGGSYAQFLFAKHMAIKGHHIIIFAADKNFLSSELRIKNLEVNYRHTIPVYYKRIGIGILNKTWELIYTFLVIKPKIKKFKPDWLIGYLRPSAIKTVILGTELKINTANFVFENPSWMQEVLSEELPKETLISLEKQWNKTRNAYNRSTILIPNSILSGQKMKEWIPNAKITSPVYPGIEKIPMSIQNRNIDIVYVGRLHFLKNIKEILLASNPSLNIVVIGTGEEYLKLHDIVKENSLNVTFLGSISNNEKWEYLQRSKLLVFPSSFEGFGMPPLEALACGCQVLCSDIPIFREIYGQDVHYFTLHDINDLRNKMTEILTSYKPTISNLTEKYSWENAATKIEKILLGEKTFTNNS